MLGRWQQAAWIAAFACIAFGFGYGFEVWRTSQQTHAPQYGYHSAQSQKEDNPTNGKGEVHKSLWERTWEDPVAFFTLWIAIFTFVLAASTIGLWIATILTLRHARETAQRELRAYIIVNGKDIEARPGCFISKLKIMNTGQTPAHKVKVLSDTRVLLHPVTKDFDFSINDSGNPSVLMLGPGIEIGQESTLKREDASREEFEEAIADNGWFRIYTYGVVTYVDIFDKPQWTNFCFYLQFSDNAAQGIASEHHNDAS